MVVGAAPAATETESGNRQQSCRNGSPSASTDFLQANRGQLVWQIGTSNQGSHVTAEFNDESGLLNDQWAESDARMLALRSRLLKLFEVRSKQRL
jgi:hypothetical protein